MAASGYLKALLALSQWIHSVLTSVGGNCSRRMQRDSRLERVLPLSITAYPLLTESGREELREEQNQFSRPFSRNWQLCAATKRDTVGFCFHLRAFS